MKVIDTLTSPQGESGVGIEENLKLTNQNYQLLSATYKEAVQHVPAYKSFLKQNHFPIQLPLQLNKIKQLPITSKNSYIHAYEMLQLFPRYHFPTIGHTSSGSSGKRTVWFRGEKQLIIGSSILDHIFKKIFYLQNDEPTLIIVSFAMGIWVAGTYISMACHHLLMDKTRYNQFTLFTPGGDIEDVLYIFKEVAPVFKKVVLFGYPPLISRILSEAKSRNIEIKDPFYIVTAGTNFSEEWRDQTLSTLNLTEKHAHHIINMYASADAGIMAHETPFSIQVRRLIKDDITLKKAILNYNPNSNYLPFLGQYYTDKIYFESINEELILTANLDMPLIRYNTRDVGHVYTASEVATALETNDICTPGIKQLSHQWNMPFVTVNWRSDVALNFHCAKIPADFLVNALQSEKIQSLLSGHFLAYIMPTANGEAFYLILETGSSILLTESQKDEIVLEIVSYLRSVCTEYNDVCKNIGEQNAYPHVDFIDFGQNYEQMVKLTTNPKILGMRNKKPRLIF